MARSTLEQTFGSATETLADKRQIRAILSVGEADREGDIVVQDGISFANFQRTKTILFNHNQDDPIAACAQIGLMGGKLQALAQFPPMGVNPQSDRIFGLIQAGVINAVSIGFLVVKSEPIGAGAGRKGMRVTSSELLEFSFVSVPANAGALITQRAARSNGGAGDATANRARMKRRLDLELLRMPCHTPRQIQMQRRQDLEQIRTEDWVAEERHAADMARITRRHPSR